MAIPAPVPPAEEQRLAALYQYELLDTPSEDLFDAFTQLAALLCDTPISLITLIDRDRQWFKSRRGITARQTPRDQAFCAHAILQDDGVFEVGDALDDVRFADNPLVTGDPEIRFYAGVPLRSADGHAVGTLCVIDRRPRTLTAEQRGALIAIGDALVEQFEARRAVLRLFDSSQTELYHIDVQARRIVFASHAGRRNLGYALEELRQLPIGDVVPALADESLVVQRIGELRSDPARRMSIRARAKRKDGSTYPVALRIELIPTHRREIALVVANDLSESEHAQQRINLLSAAIEAAQDPIVIAKPGATAEDPATIVYANEAFIRHKGAQAPDAVIGHRVDEFFGPKTDRAKLVFMRQEVMAGRPARVEYISYRADGSYYHTESSARPLVDETGRTTHYVVVQRDVTEQVLRGAQLAMQNERLTAITSIARTLFASLEPSVLVDALLSGVHELVGGRATLYAPRPRGGFVATSDLTLHDGAEPADAFVALASRSDVCVLDEHEQRAAVRVPGSGGGTAYVLDVVRDDTPFSTADVFAIGLLGQYFAVAARNVELYLELASRRDAVVELNQVKNDLIAMLAHDFKGPLTTIVGFADVLADDDRFDVESRQYLGMISSSAMRLASLATDTLAISRLEQNELALTLAEIDLVPMVRDVVRVFSVTRPIDLRVAPGSLVVICDEQRLRQVIENLVGNAIKYSPGGEAVEVALRVRPAGVEIAVRDRGIGIPDGERGKLFGRFARASNARALGIGGTGFGLYLARTIVDLHGGHIDVESVEGQGSTFRVFVPGRPPRHANLARRIALLDVDGDARSYVAHALRDDGYAVSVATGGEELLRVLGDGSFDVALVDSDKLGMPAETFLERAQRTVPLVRMSLRMPADTNGWDAVLTKPFLMKDLYGALDAALDHANGRPSSAPGGSNGSP
jgi:PAS domain S-box-containing protein